MKKLLCVCFLITGLTLSNHPQAKAQTSRVGLMAGLSAANVNGSDFDTQVRTGIMIGAYYRFLLSGGALFLQPEVGYVQRGYKEDFQGGDIITKLNYINLNLLLTYHFISSGSIMPFVALGPYFALIASAKREFDDEEQDIDDFINGSDFGVQVRAGIILTKIMIAAYLTQGLRSIFDDSQFDESQDDIRNITFGILVGFNLY